MATPLTYIRLDPIVASVRLLASNNIQSRLTPNTVSLELLPSLFYTEEETEIAVSVVLSDGRRLLITDPSEISLNSSNTSVISTRLNTISGINEGVADVTVSWVVCGRVLASHVISVSVEIDQGRPMFIPDNGNASIPEDSSVGSIITRVTAIDEDVINAQTNDIQYSLRGSDPYNGLFTINRYTGDVILNGLLDRESVNNYTLLIDATDSVQRRELANCQRQQGGGGGTTTPPTMSPDISGSGSGASGSGSDGNMVTTPTDPPPCTTTVNFFTVSWGYRYKLGTFTCMFINISGTAYNNY